MSSVPVSLPVVPGEPDLPVYSLEDLELFDSLTPATAVMLAGVYSILRGLVGKGSTAS